MLTKRVIPCLDVKDGRVVKGINFVSLRDAGDPVELASAYDREGADEVIFLDITATSDNRSTTIDTGVACGGRTRRFPTRWAAVLGTSRACGAWWLPARTRCRSIRRR